MRVLVYCQHVLGMGHLYRCLELVRAFAASPARHEVTLVTGGPEAPFDLPQDVRHEQLPGLRMDASFSRLLPAPDSEGRSLDDIRQERSARLMALVEEIKPQIFLVELFPFGRRQFSFELLPALELARRGTSAPCRTVCSVRDILVEKNDQDKYEQRVLAPLNRFFDLVLVHSDPEVISLEQTFSRMADVRPAVAYTGYVAQPPARGAGTALRQELNIPAELPLIVASAGSGSVGGDLLLATLEASAVLQRLAPHTLAVFGGPLMDNASFARLETLAAAHAHVRLRRHSGRFPVWLDAASMSVSMGGYNTVMALVAARTFGLVLPFAQNREQRMRAELLEQRGLLRMLEAGDIEPGRLAGLMHKGLQAPPAERQSLDIKGAANSVRCLEDLQARPQRRGAVRREAGMPWQGFSRRKDQPGFDEFFERFKELCDRYRTAEVFFRADDVAVPGPAGGALERMLKSFLRRETPLWPAVVPAWLNQGHWRRLKELTRGSALFCWHQHGWRHAGHQVCGKKSEFPPGRALTLKLADLIKGRNRLARFMGEGMATCLTPPWNRLDRLTLEELPRLGYTLLSADSRLCLKTAKMKGLGVLPVHLDLHTRRESDRREALEAMLAEAERGLAGGLLGVMLHHQRMNEQAFSFLDSLLLAVRESGLSPVGRERFQEGTWS